LKGNSISGKETFAYLYIARPPISLKKVFYEPFHSKVLFKTKYNDYFKENVKMFDAQDFIADLTLHIPPKNVQYIRRYGLYASRTRGIWTSMPEVIARAPEGWKNEHLDDVDIKAEGEREDPHISISEKDKRSAWARLLSKIYEVHAFVCPKCSSDMQVIAVIMDPNADKPHSLLKEFSCQKSKKIVIKVLMWINHIHD